MIFFTDNDGTIIKSFPSPVYQGSANTNTIYLISPMSGVQASVAFMLPNGEATERMPMTYQNAIEGVVNENGQTYAGWTYSLPNSITMYYGVVDVQFFFYSSTTGELTGTSMTSFVVAKGVPEVLPSIPDETVYEAILSQIASLREQLISGYFASRAIYPWNTTYTYGIDEIVYYPDIGEYGALVQSKSSGNTGNTPYNADGSVNSQWWTEVVNFNTVTDDFFTQVKNALEEAQQAAKDAQDAAQNIGKYVGKQVQFVTSVADMTQENVLYGIVTDASENLFDLYGVENGVPVKLGSANLVMNVTTYYSGVLTVSGWTNNAQTLLFEDVTADDDAVVTPVNEDAAAYITNGIEAVATVSGGISFSCTSVPSVAISVIVGITKQQEVPTANGYYTQAQVDALFQNYITVNGDTLVVNK